MSDLFKKALQAHLRFNLGNGEVNTEDLLSYHEDKLDVLYSSLYETLQSSQKVSLLSTKSNANKTIELKMAIIKEIVEDKLAVKLAKETKAIKAEKARVLREKIAAKKDIALDELSIDEMEAQLAELGE